MHQVQNTVDPSFTAIEEGSAHPSPARDLDIESLLARMRAHQLKTTQTQDLAAPDPQAGKRTSLPPGIQTHPHAAPEDRYRDGGPGPVPDQRWIRFESSGSLDENHSGALLIEISTGRIVMERSQRTNPASMIRSESRITQFGEIAPGHWQEVEIRSLERWVTAHGETIVQRHTCVTSRPCAAGDAGPGVADPPFSFPE